MHYEQNIDVPVALVNRATDDDYTQVVQRLADHGWITPQEYAPDGPSILGSWYITQLTSSRSATDWMMDTHTADGHVTRYASTDAPLLSSIRTFGHQRGIGMLSYGGFFTRAQSVSDGKK